MSVRSFNPIVPGVNLSETLASLDDWTERLWWRFHAQADSWGRFHGSATRIRAKCVPLLTKTEADVQQALDALADCGLLVFYEVDSQRYAYVPSWDMHQTRERVQKRGASLFPDPAAEPLPAKPKPRAKQRDEQGRDPTWDALVVVFGDAPKTTSGRGAWNKAAKELREIGATPDRIKAAAAAYRREWPTVEISPSALAKHFHKFDTQTPASNIDEAAARWAENVGRSLNLREFEAELAEWRGRGLSEEAAALLLEQQHASVAL